MSKIGKQNISIPDKVKVFLNGNMLNIEGPLGKKSINIDVEMFDLSVEDGKHSYGTYIHIYICTYIHIYLLVWTIIFHPNKTTSML